MARVWCFADHDTAGGAVASCVIDHDGSDDQDCHQRGIKREKNSNKKGARLKPTRGHAGVRYANVSLGELTIGAGPLDDGGCKGGGGTFGTVVHAHSEASTSLTNAASRTP